MGQAQINEHFMTMFRVFVACQSSSAHVCCNPLCGHAWAVMRLTTYKDYGACWSHARDSNKYYSVAMHIMSVLQQPSHSCCYNSSLLVLASDSLNASTY